MIERRAFLKSFCSVIAAPFAILPVMTKYWRSTDPGTDAYPPLLLFSIQGWEGAELAVPQGTGQQIVPLYLPYSWRAPWL